MDQPTVRSFDPDAPDEGWSEHEEWVDPDPWGDEAGGDVWVEPMDDLVLDTLTARADWAFGRCVDTATPEEVLRTVAADIAAWDVEALMTETAIDTFVPMDGPPPEPVVSDRPEVVVLRSLLRHANRPEDLGTVLLQGWLEDTVERSPWTALIALAQPTPIDDDAVATAVTEALDACRGEQPPAWAMLLVAAAAARPTGPAHDLLALVGFPQDQPERLWIDVEKQAKGFPGGVRDRARSGAESLGWDGRRHESLVETLVEELRRSDKRKRASSFAPEIIVCPHGPVVITPSAIGLPMTTRGEKPYVAKIVGSHPVFRLKRDWPDRNDEAGGTVWSWEGPVVLESRDLGCDGCRNDPDGGKRYILSTGEEVAPVRLRQLRAVLDRLDEGGAGP